MFLSWAILVIGGAGPWDWYLYAASLIAAITAIVPLLTVGIAASKSPRGGIDWAFSLDGDPAKLEDWPADHVPESSRVSYGAVQQYREMIPTEAYRRGEQCIVHYYLWSSGRGNNCVVLAG